MGSLYWWIEAPSADDIMRTYAEVRAIDAATVDKARFGNISSLRLGDPAPAGLAELQEQRDAQRGLPGFGALTGRGTVYLKREWPEGEETYFLELDKEGCRMRQVCLSYDGQAERTTDQHWIFNPPEDLWDPELAACEIGKEEFETRWQQASDAPPID